MDALPDQIIDPHDVLTLDELAAHLRLPREVVEQQAKKGVLPGRQFENEWRFSKSTINFWLGRRDTRTVLLEAASAFHGDETLAALRAAIYEARGRPEVDEKPAPRKRTTRRNGKTGKAG